MKNVIALVFTCFFTTQCFALPAKHRPIFVKGDGNPLIGWVEFCSNEMYKTECTFGQDEPKRIVLTADVWTKLTDINQYVNRTIKPITDPLHWGENVIERWDLAEDGYGDCEDHQLLKRQMLAKVGLPRRAMRMTLVLDTKGEGHAVLMIKTDRGDFLLDNLTNDILSWEDTPYTYLRQEGQDNPKEWVKLHPDDSDPDAVVAGGPE